jgi:hypothetical protein
MELAEGMSEFEGSLYRPSRVGASSEAGSGESKHAEASTAASSSEVTTATAQHEVVSVVFREKWSVKEDTVREQGHETAPPL